LKRICVILLVALSLLALLLLGGCGTTETSEPVPDNPYAQGRVGTDSTLEVMTWNIENFAKRGAVTADHVIDVVKGLQVDIIALQEIENLTYFQQVREGLADWTGDRATSASYQMNLAFLYPVDGVAQISAVYEILTEYRRELPRAPFVLEGTFRGTEFVVINNHFKASGNNILDETDAWDEETRRRDASLLIDDFIRTQFPDKAVIVVGDLNDELTDSPANNVFQNFLDASDMYRFVDLAIARDSGGLWSYPTWPSHLDHILITHQLFAAQERSDALVEVAPLHILLGQGWSVYEKNVSDHLPVVLRLKL
jgi:endonuclease/exonuclease/phosphatase family metal-dependent hydrolase